MIPFFAHSGQKGQRIGPFFLRRLRGYWKSWEWIGSLTIAISKPTTLCPNTRPRNGFALWFMTWILKSNRFANSSCWWILNSLVWKSTKKVSTSTYFGEQEYFKKGGYMAFLCLNILLLNYLYLEKDLMHLLFEVEVDGKMYNLFDIQRVKKNLRIPLSLSFHSKTFGTSWNTFPINLSFVFVIFIMLPYIYIENIGRQCKRLQVFFFFRIPRQKMVYEIKKLFHSFLKIWFIKIYERNKFEKITFRCFDAS